MKLQLVSLLLLGSLAATIAIDVGAEEGVARKKKRMKRARAAVAAVAEKPENPDAKNSKDASITHILPSLGNVTVQQGETYVRFRVVGNVEWDGVRARAIGSDGTHFEECILNSVGNNFYDALIPAPSGFSEPYPAFSIRAQAAFTDAAAAESHPIGFLGVAYDPFGEKRAAVAVTTNPLQIQKPLKNDPITPDGQGKIGVWVKVVEGEVAGGPGAVRARAVTSQLWDSANLVLDESDGIYKGKIVAPQGDESVVHYNLRVEVDLKNDGQVHKPFEYAGYKVKWP